MNIKAAIFDMDGTLVDSLIFWDLLWSEMGGRFLQDKSFRPEPADDKAVRTLTMWDAMELIHTHYGAGQSTEELFHFANDLIVDLYTNRVQPKEGVREFLEACSANGVKMCVASATTTDLVDLVLNRCGIRKYFSRLFSCAEVGKGKSEPDIFLMAARYLGEKPEDTWMFEDSLVAIETATKIGMPTVGIYDRNNYGQETIRQLATHYIGPGETLLKLIK